MADRICSVDGCEREIRARGWCDLHYRRWRRHGDVLWTPPMHVAMPCGVDGCDRNAVAKDLCHTHYARWKRHGDAGNAALSRISRQERVCRVPGCFQIPHGRNLCSKHYGRFQRTGLLADRVCPYCGQPLGPDSRKRHCTEHAIEHAKIKMRAATIRKHGITVDQYEALLIAQRQRCAVCGSREPGGHGRWHIDHDHACCPGPFACGACIRGLLCAACNASIGLMRDDPQVLRQAAAYLERPAQVAMQF